MILAERTLLWGALDVLPNSNSLTSKKSLDHYTIPPVFWFHLELLKVGNTFCIGDEEKPAEADYLRIRRFSYLVGAYEGILTGAVAV